MSEEKAVGEMLCWGGHTREIIIKHNGYPGVPPLTKNRIENMLRQHFGHVRAITYKKQHVKGSLYFSPSVALLFSLPLTLSLCRYLFRLSLSAFSPFLLSVFRSSLLACPLPSLTLRVACALPACFASHVALPHQLPS